MHSLTCIPASRRGTPQRAHENGMTLCLRCRCTAHRAHEAGMVSGNDSGIMHRENQGTMLRAPTVEKYGKPSSDTIPTIIRSYKAVGTKQGTMLREKQGTVLRASTDNKKRKIL